MSPGSHQPSSRRLGQQVAAPAAVDADDRRFGLQHARQSCPRPARMRVVAGELGGRRLVAPDGRDDAADDRQGPRGGVQLARPHAVSLDGAVVADLFAGSGALGIEALSRGAERCTFVERDRDALAALRAEHRRARARRPRHGRRPSDVLAWVPAMRGIDLAFARPAVRRSTRGTRLLGDARRRVRVVRGRRRGRRRPRDGGRCAPVATAGRGRRSSASDA